MIHTVFTLDYEIYGNGEGTLQSLVLDPTRELAGLFGEFDAPLVIYAEAVEFSKIEERQTDPNIAAVASQLRELRSAGHEISLHLHPWWANAKFEGGHWLLDWTERNICELPAERIDAIVSSAIAYLRRALNDPAYTPLSFRGGLWAMQPTRVMAEVLVKHGIHVDSSVFKGGYIQALGLDYRPSLRNANSWRFSQDVNVPDPSGFLWEIPIHTKMVPFWQMLSSKRLKVHKRVPTSAHGNPLPRRWRDYARFRYPRKLDFCRMTFEEMRGYIDGVIETSLRAEDQVVVAIGHSKDLTDLDAIRQLLDYLRKRDVAVTTFARLLGRESAAPSEHPIATSVQPL